MSLCIFTLVVTLLAVGVRALDLSPTPTLLSVPLVSCSRTYSLTLDTTTLSLNQAGCSGTLPVEWSLLINLTSLELRSNQVVGSLPQEWSALTSLSYVDLSFNELTGSLPKEWGALSLLTTLNLNNNLISASLPPAWSSLGILLNLGLNKNLLEGPLPPEWGALTGLSYLDLSFNNQISSTLPKEWMYMQGLQNMRLNFNSIGGSLPQEWSLMRDLMYIDVTMNSLTGKLPKEWAAFSNISAVFLLNNRITGSLPKEWMAMSSLTALILNSNQLTGVLPTEWSALDKLGILYLEHNSLNGTLPKEWSAMTALSQLSLLANQLTGSIPPEWISSSFGYNVMCNDVQGKQLCTLGSCASACSPPVPPSPPRPPPPSPPAPPVPLPLLNCSRSYSLPLNTTTLVLNQAGCTGTLPAAWSKLANLSDLELYGNRLTGSLPREWSALKQLRTLYLTWNNLTHDLPKEWSSLTNLAFLSLGANQLSGAIPQEWGAMAKLIGFDAYSNQLVGPLPLQFSALSQLWYFDISHNNLTGFLPREWSALDSAQELFLNNNRLSGSLPKEWKALNHNLLYLHLGSNMLTGSLPKEWSSWAKVVEVDLSLNQLTGTLPQEWSALKKLSNLVLGHNGQIGGSWPKGWSRDGLSYDLSCTQVNITPVCVGNDCGNQTAQCSPSSPPLAYPPPRGPVPPRPPPALVPFLPGLFPTSSPPDPQPAPASPSSSRSSRSRLTGIVVGGVVGGLALIGALLGAGIWARARRSGDGRRLGAKKVASETALMTMRSFDSPQHFKARVSLFPRTSEAKPGSAIQQCIEAAEDILSRSHRVLVNQGQCHRLAMAVARLLPVLHSLHQQPQQPEGLDDACDAPSAVECLADAPLTLGHVGSVSTSKSDRQAILQDTLAALEACLTCISRWTGNGCTLERASVRGAVDLQGLVTQFCSEECNREFLDLSNRLRVLRVACGSSRLASADAAGASGPADGSAKLSDVCLSVPASPFLARDETAAAPSSPFLIRGEAAAAPSSPFLTRDEAAAAPSTPFLMRDGTAATDTTMTMTATMEVEGDPEDQLPIEEALLNARRSDLMAFIAKLVQSGGYEGWSPDKVEMLHQFCSANGFSLAQLILEEEKRLVLFSDRLVRSQGVASCIDDLHYIRTEDIHGPGGVGSKLQYLAMGGFGVVHKGVWQDEDVAIKKMDGASVADAKELAREAYIMSNCRHPNIAEIFGLARDPDTGAMWIVMKYYESGSLKDVMHGSGAAQLTLAAKVQIAMDVARGMAYLHSKPHEMIIHGDLKPANVLVDAGMRCFISDFGMASMKTCTHTIAPTSNAQSLFYTAPELLESPSSKRTTDADVFAYAMILYEVFTGMTPFAGANGPTIMALIMSNRRPDIPVPAPQPEVYTRASITSNIGHRLHTSADGMPLPIANIVQSCWVQDPWDRPTFSQVVLSLEVAAMALQVQLDA